MLQGGARFTWGLRRSDKEPADSVCFRKGQVADLGAGRRDQNLSLSSGGLGEGLEAVWAEEGRACKSCAELL